jgi:hypothetical protein
MAETVITIDPLIQKFIVDGTSNLISKIQADLKDEEQLSERTYQTCNSILNEATKEYNRIRVAFVDETRILIEKALRQPQPQPTPRYHKTWLHILEIFTAACEKLTGPILQVLNSVSIESERLKHKYRLFVSGGIGSGLIAVVLVSALFVHFCPIIPACLFTAGGIVAAIIGLAIAVGLVISCVIGAMSVAKIRGIYDRCTSELKALLAKFMPKIFSPSKNIVTERDLQHAIKDALNTFKIKEESWADTDTLEMLHRQTNRVLSELKENK